jgi:TolB-like protein/class 3 adenylate cyclase
LERRLAAILAADVVGYSRLMGKDEAGTLAALKAHHEELIEPKIAEHKGRIVKLMGDGVLAEFPSAVEAVQFAVQIQHTMAERNADVPEAPRITYRIGINIGDIIVEGDDIYGDGVNVAARLESLAEPGGICVRRNVRNQVRDKLDIDFEDLGEIEVKNIARPVRAFRVVLDAKSAALVTPIVPLPIARNKRLRPLLAAGLALSVVVAAAFFWWQPWIVRLQPASLAQMAFPLPGKPSIAVLPFDNLTGDPDQGHIADGMSETIISTLSRIPELFVIARNSSFTYKGKAVKVQQVAEELGVRYVLEGSLQRSGDAVRITVQLIDALKGHHLWSESYDRELDDLFDLQDDIALKTTIALQVELTTGEEARMLSRTTENVRAWTLYQQALSNFFKFSKEGIARARRIAQTALAEDPTFADAMIIVGFTHLVDARSGFGPSPEDSLKRAIESADDARALAPEAPNLFNLMQSIYRYRKEFDKAVVAGERAIELSPNSAISLLAMTMTTNLAGQFDRSSELARRAIRHSPHHRSTGLIWLARALWFQRKYSEAIDAATEGLERAESPDIVAAHLLNLALAYVGTDEMGKARQAVRDALEKAPRLSLSYLESGFGYKKDSDWQRLASALRSAGLPE